MKGKILIFIIALGILCGTFAGYLNWLLIQPRPMVVQAEAPSSSTHRLHARSNMH